MNAPWLTALLLWGCSDFDGDGKSGGGDCDDTNPAVHKNATEVCDGVDNDCDGLVDEDVAIVAYLDRDGDGFGDDAMVRRVCTLPPDGSTVGGDCDDQASGIHPDAVEVCDGIDNDCSGTIDEDVTVAFYVDADGDGSGAGPAEQTGDCWPPEGYSLDDDDCDDADPLRSPRLAETCDGIDNDCNGDVDDGLALVPVYEDADGDGSGDPTTATLACGALGDRVADGRDCDDSDPDVGAFAPDLAGNGLDEDCDGYIDELGVPSLYPDVPAALADAQPGDVVQLEDGVFAVNLDLRGHDVTLAGNGCAHTTLFGSFDGSVLQMDGGAVENLTVANGSGTLWPWAGQSTTHFGGGLFVREGHVDVRGTCFVSNSVDGAGGAIAVLRDASLTVTDSSFEGNAAARPGGAIHGDRATIEIRRSRFLRNRSGSWRGGALGVMGGYLDVQGTSFAHDTSEDGGGTVALFPVGAHHDPNNVPELLQEPPTAYFSHVTMHGSTTTSNTESTFYVRGAHLTIEHSILSGNVGNGDPGNLFRVIDYDRVDTGEEVESELFFTNLGLQHPYGIEEIGLAQGWVLSATRGAPAYVDPAAGDLRLLPTSPFRDLGPGTDPDGSAADLGAYSGPWALPGGGDDDVDGDGMVDLWEAHHGIDDPAQDPDGDGLSNLDEIGASTDPNTADTDGDGVDDAAEIAAGTDPDEPRDQQPTADAGLDRLVLVGAPVVLDDAASFDPNGDTLTTSWALTTPAGSAAALAGATFTPDVPGLYTVELTVDDGTTSDSHAITVEALDGVLVDSTEALAQAVADGESVVALASGVYTDVALTPVEPLTVFGVGDVTLVASPTLPAFNGGSTPLRLAQLTARRDTPLDGHGGIVSWLLSANAQDPHGASLTIERARFEDAQVTGNGGAVLVRNLESTVLRDVTFVNCTADDGAAVHSEEGPISAERITVTGSQADRGVLYFHTLSSSDRIEIEDLWLVENQATHVVHLERNADLYLSHAAWLGNVAERGLWLSSTHGGTTSVYADQVLFERNRFERGGAPAAAINGASFIARVHEIQASDVERVFGPSALEGPTRRVEADLRPGRFILDGVYDDVIWPRLGSSVVDRGWVGTLDRDGSRSDFALRPRRPSDVRWKIDADADGMSDGWEVHFGLDPYSDDSAGDPDGDGLDNGAEHAAGTDPNLPDTDLDGVDDATEVAGGSTDPLDPYDNRPIARLASPPGPIFAGESVLLDGSASSDPNGTPLTWHWTLVATPPGSTLTDADLLHPDTAVPTLVPDVRGDYRVELIVDDGLLLSEPVQIEIFVKGTLQVPAIYDLDTALALATDGEVVHIADGTYELPTIVPPEGESRTVRGSGATVLLARDGDRHASVQVNSSLTLEDLELRGGLGNRGGAVLCDRGELTATNVVFAGNRALYGGAIALDRCEAALSDVHLVDNEALVNGGGLWLSYGAVDWQRGSVQRNVAGNRGGGLFTDQELNLVSGDEVALTNLVIADNQAADGGAAYHRASRVVAHHLTVVGNTAPNDRGGIYLLNSPSTVTASILAYNRGPQVRIFDGLPLPKTFDDVIAWRPEDPSNWYQAASLPGPDVRVLDPKFAGDSRYLAYGSPGIDGASGQDPDGSAADIGAFGGPGAPDDYRSWYEDEDGDGMADRWELTYGLDPGELADAALDLDGDGLANLQEHDLGLAPDTADTDADGVDDATEVGSSDPLDPDDNRPLAFAGFDQVVAPGTLVTVDGQFSADPNGDDLDPTWSLIAAPATSSLTLGPLPLQGPTSAQATPDVPGAFVFELVMNDGLVDSPPATVTVRVEGMVRVPEDYATVAEAIDAVAPGGLVQIGAGSWDAAGVALGGKDVSLAGAGTSATVLDAGRAGRFLDASLGETVQIEAMTLTGGQTGRGGALKVSGLNSGQPGGVRGVLSLTDVHLQDHRAVQGGALYIEDADVFLARVRVVDNRAADDGGAIDLDGSLLDVANALFAGNRSHGGDGGAIYVNRSDLVGTNLVFADNHAVNGGGLAFDGASLDPSFDLRFVTAVHNTAISRGGFANVRYATASSLSHALVVANGRKAIDSAAMTFPLDVTLDHSWFFANAEEPFPAGMFLSEQAVSVDDPGLLHSDDGDWTNDTWLLAPGAAAAGTGDPTLGLLDVDGSSLDPGALGGPDALPL